MRLQRRLHSLHAAYDRAFQYFEIFSIIVFSIEYLLRVWVAPLKYADLKGKGARARIKYILSLNGIIDFLSIIPFYLQFLLPGLDLRILRTLRLLRILKLSTYNSALSDLIEAIQEERRSFIAAGYIFVVMFIIASSLIYFAEHKNHPTHFTSIPDSMYWALITLTTVGYGDVTPVTALGKLISVISAMGGVVVAFTITAWLDCLCFAATLQKCIPNYRFRHVFIEHRYTIYISASRIFDLEGKDVISQGSTIFAGKDQIDTIQKNV